MPGRGVATVVSSIPMGRSRMAGTVAIAAGSPGEVHRASAFSASSLGSLWSTPIGCSISCRRCSRKRQTSKFVFSSPLKHIFNMAAIISDGFPVTSGRQQLQFLPAAGDPSSVGRPGGAL
jgi:hypothetical protein